LIGGTGPGDDTIQFPKVLAGVLGAKLKIIAGYPGGGNDAVLAMERGELQGRCGWSYSSVKAAHPDWLAQTSRRRPVWRAAALPALGHQLRATASVVRRLDHRLSSKLCATPINAMKTST
jgi:hypothetical protein